MSNKPDNTTGNSDKYSDIQDQNFDTRNRDRCIEYISQSDVWLVLDEVIERKDEEAIKIKLQQIPAMNEFIEKCIKTSIADALADKWIEYADTIERDADFFQFLSRTNIEYGKLLSNAEDAEKSYLDKIQSLTRDSKTDEALGLINEALEKFPECCALYIEKATLNPSDEESLMAWNEALFLSADAQTSIKCVTNIVNIQKETTPDFVYNIYETKIAQLGRRNTKEALALFLGVLDISPEDDDNHKKDFKQRIEVLFTQQFNSLLEQIDSNRQEIQELTKSLDEAKVTTASGEELINNLQTELDEVKIIADDAEQEKSQLREEIVKFESKLEQRDVNISKFRGSAFGSILIISEIEADITKLTKQLAEADKCSSGAKQKIIDLELKLQTAKQNKEEVERDLVATEKEQAWQSQQLEQMLTQLNEAQARIIELNSALAEANQRVASIEQSAGERERELEKNTARKLEEAEQRILNISSELEKLKPALEVSEQQTDEDKEHIKELEAQLREAGQSVEDNINKIRELEIVLRNANERHEESARGVIGLEKLLESASKRAKEAEQRASGLNADLVEADEHAQNLKNQLAVANQELNVAKRCIQEFEKLGQEVVSHTEQSVFDADDIEDVSTDLASALEQAQKRVAEQRMGALNAKLETLQNRINELEASLVTAEKRAKEAEINVADLNSSLTNANKRADTAGERVTDLEKQLTEADQNKSGQETEIELLSQQNDEKQREIDGLQQRITEFQQVADEKQEVEYVVSPETLIAQMPVPEKISALNIDEPLTVEEGKHIQLPIAMTGDKITVKNNAAVTIDILDAGASIHLSKKNSFVVIEETSKECGDNPVEIIIDGKERPLPPIVLGKKASEDHIMIVYINE